MQLHPADGDQHARDVAGGDLRSPHHRPGARLGRGPRLQLRPGLPPLPSLAAGRRRVPAPARTLPRDRRSSPHRDDVRSLRRLLEPQVRPGPTAGAASGRPQLGLDPMPGPRASRKSGALGYPRGLYEGCRRVLPGGPAGPGLGPLQRTGKFRLRIAIAAPGPERLRLGPRGRPGPAPDRRHLGRIEGPRGAQPVPGRTVGHHLVPLLPDAGRRGKADRGHEGLGPPGRLHRIHGPDGRQPLRGDPAALQGPRRRGHELGLRQGQNANGLSLGLEGRRHGTGGLVPRRPAARRSPLHPGRGGAHPPAGWKGGARGGQEAGGPSASPSTPGPSRRPLAGTAGIRSARP